MVGKEKFIKIINEERNESYLFIRQKKIYITHHTPHAHTRMNSHTLTLRLKQLSCAIEKKIYLR